ncbi:methyl-accepting chemotaxis protein [Halobacteriovorax sp.]|uniref:HAMP domain-containing methyl-accepting chemotaxis protein n=1 Tax=Halobacteriovorax sp. TaxID=2020862 RepID=UPI0035616A76
MKNINFKIKLILLCLFMSSVSLIIGTVSFFGFQHFIELSHEISQDVIPRSTLLSRMDINYQKTRIAVRTLGLEHLPEDDRIQAIEDSIKAVGAYEAVSKRLSEKLTNPIEKELYSNLEKKWENFKAVGVEAISLAKIYDEASREKLLNIFLVLCPAAAKDYQATLDKYEHYIHEEVLHSSDESAETASFLDFLILSISAVGVITGLVTGFIFAGRISSKIKDTLTSLHQSSSYLTQSADSIAETSSSLSSSSQQQDSSLQESSTSLEEISSMIRMTADNAHKSNDLARSSLDKASSGKRIVSKMIQSMGDIDHSIDTIVEELDQNNEKMKHITDLINRIEEKTQIINDIVFQTKLLSFNASVEAARAGEAGKGFAVVAEEVGKLAELSGKASIDIADMVSSSVEQVNLIVKESQGRVSSLVQSVRSNVSNGSTVANECGEILENIVSSVAEVTSAISEISTASSEQSKGIDELQVSILQVDSSSKSNTGIAKDTSEIATKLKDQVTLVNCSITEIQTVILGDIKKAS